MDELQEMREQMAALKEKLNKQEIINEKNLRKLMFRKALRFKIFMWIGILLMATPTVALWIMNFAWFEGTHTDFELIWETITTSIMLTMLIIGTSIIKLRDIRSGNLQTVKEQIITQYPTITTMKNNEKIAVYLQICKKSSTFAG